MRADGFNRCKYNLVAHSRADFNGLEVIVKKYFSYEENELHFYFRSSNVALHIDESTWGWTSHFGFHEFIQGF